MTELTDWGNFYLIVGAAAGALIGLQFVSLTLISQRTTATHSGAGSAFATPTIVHFSAALLIAGLTTVPWHSVKFAALFWGIAGFAGLIYEIVVTWKIRQQESYEPELEDWAFHCLLPFIAYATLGVAAISSLGYLKESLFAIAASTLLLLFIGIHNSWDAVTWHVFQRGSVNNESDES